MKRIDSINARPNMNGTGKAGFSDNTDLIAHDATYLTPDYLNHLQEELCNILEKNGIVLNASQRDQLYQLLATNADIDALAAATQIKLDQEQTWRENADNDLQQQINNEQTARVWSDNLLSDKIDLKFDKAGGDIDGDVLVKGNLKTNAGVLFNSKSVGHGSQDSWFHVGYGFDSNWRVNFQSNDDYIKYAFDKNIEVKGSLISIDDDKYVSMSASKNSNKAFLNTSLSAFEFNKPIYAPNIGNRTSWIAVTSSRQLNTTYSNPYDRDLHVLISIQDNLGNSPLTINVQGTVILDISDFGAGGTHPIFFTVPAFQFYSVDSPANGVNTIRCWSERS